MCSSRDLGLSIISGSVHVLSQNARIWNKGNCNKRVADPGGVDPDTDQTQEKT